MARQFTKFERKQKTELILLAAVACAAKPGGWFSLTRERIAKQAGVTDSLVSRYLGNMQDVRRKVMKIAKASGRNEIINQSIAANDGFAR